MGYYDELTTYVEASERYASSVNSLLAKLAEAVASLELAVASLEARLVGLERVLHDRTDHLA